MKRGERTKKDTTRTRGRLVSFYFERKVTPSMRAVLLLKHLWLSFLEKREMK